MQNLTRFIPKAKLSLTSAFIRHRSSLFAVGYSMSRSVLTAEEWTISVLSHQKVGVIPRVHGSGMFTRGQTQVLTIATLGPVSDKQLLDGIDGETEKRYIHHYNFPSYSVGETKPSRGPGRREIGHGALAERALVPVIPSVEEFPYALRLVSEVLSSNGSTSQGSICGSTLALMDAGVPIKAPVAGISCGLITEGNPLDDGFLIFRALRTSSVIWTLR